jgi:hypothetical protein
VGQVVSHPVDFEREVVLAAPGALVPTSRDGAEDALEGLLDAVGVGEVVAAELELVGGGLACAAVAVRETRGGQQPADAEHEQRDPTRGRDEAHAKVADEVADTAPFASLGGGRPGGLLAGGELAHGPGHIVALEVPIGRDEEHRGDGQD